MNYLLDTHTFLWFLNADANLSTPARKLIADGENMIFLSVASVWEMAIKVSLAKLELPSPFADFIGEQLLANGFVLHPIRLKHIGFVATLPFHHRDPFDRLIIAQSLADDLPIIGQDTLFDAYGVSRRW